MGAAIEDVDYYALLEVEPTATLQEIRTAYRKKSLKVHPDRNPDNPEAASLFHDLSIAHNLLIDPTQRASFDSLRAAREAKKARFANLDNKRKAMAEDLERREQEFKRSKTEEDRKRNGQMSELEKLKEEGRRMREAREKAAQSSRDQDAELDRQRAEEERRRNQAADAASHSLGELDTTLRIKFSQALRPTLTTPEALRTLLSVLLAPAQPDIDSIPIFKLKEPKPLKEGKKPKASAKDKEKGTAMVQFRTLRAAVRLVERYEEGKGDRMWEGLEVGWAAGSAPAILGDRAPKQSAEPPAQSAPPQPASAAFPPSMMSDSDEARTLAQLRAKERERLIAEMQKADEEAA